MAWWQRPTAVRPSSCSGTRGPPDITAAPVTGYKIQVSPLNSAGDDCAGDWDDLVADTMSTTTSYTHMGLSAGTGMCYRVFGINDVAISTGFVGYGDPYPATKDNDAIATTDPAVVPGMPMALSATAVSDMQIDLMWNASRRRRRFRHHRLRAGSEVR